MTRPRKVAALLLVLTFSLGALSGMAIEEATGIDWFEFLDTESDAERDELNLLGGIQLSGEQRERIEEIVDRQEDDLENYWKTRMPEIQGILARTYAEIRTHLTADQRRAFDRNVSTLKGEVPKEFQD